jgi:hypothetical protein
MIVISRANNELEATGDGVMVSDQLDG